MNKVCVRGQRIYFYRPPEPIPKLQVNFSRIEFDMDETWSSFLSVVAQFIQNGEAKNVKVEDGYCFVPPELDIGVFELCLRGDDGESVVATVNRLTLEVCEGFDPSGETPLPPSPDLYTQLIKEIDSGKKIAQSVREDADSGKFNGPPGIKGDTGDDGITPHIGDNGNWYLGDKDTGKPSRGDPGPKGDTGETGPQGEQGPKGDTGAPGPTYTAGTNITISADNVISATGGGGSVQPDWNQNDSTASDYVKNRPFYTGDPVETVLVEASTISFSGTGGIYQGKFSSTFSPTIGETYKVSWDGTVYE